MFISQNENCEKQSRWRLLLRCDAIRSQIHLMIEEIDESHSELAHTLCREHLINNNIFASPIIGGFGVDIALDNCSGHDGRASICRTRRRL